MPRRDAAAGACGRRAPATRRRRPRRPGHRRRRPAATQPESAARAAPASAPSSRRPLLSAVLASGGTVARPRAGGRLRPAGARVLDAGIGQPTAGQQPVTIDESSAVIDAAAKVGPGRRQDHDPGRRRTDPFGAVPTQGVGSGVIYDANGWILTNRHVVADADKLTVELKDGRQFEGTVYGIDTLTDLAIVKVDATGLPGRPDRQ